MHRIDDNYFVDIENFLEKILASTDPNNFTFGGS
jgi:hypothetical protein